jgi:hypothetical protein
MSFHGTDFINKAASACDYLGWDLNLCFQNKRKLSDSKANLHVMILPEALLFDSDGNRILPPEPLETHCHSLPYSPPQIVV